MRVVIADDALLVRKGIAALLRDAGIEVAAEVDDGDELLAAVDEHEPDVAIVDIRMPPTHTDEGLRAEQIRESHPEVGVLVPALPRAALRDAATRAAPGRQWVSTKERVSDLAILTRALARLEQGECVLDLTIVARLVERPRRKAARRAHHRERECSP
jgi:DNA-binding NarL/FixJ family response regulator